jgi:hypothetical protein
MTGKQASELVKALGLQKEVIKISRAYPNRFNSIKEAQYFVIASLIREGFFKKYKGLESRLEREHAFAIKHHYVRAWHGPMRHLGKLKYFNVNSSGNVIGFDKEIYSEMFRGMMNDAGNSTIQTFEAVLAVMAVLTITYYLIKWGMESYIWNFVHDSICFVSQKGEEELLSALAKEVCTKSRYEFFSVPMDIDFDISDLNCPDQYYCHGVAVKPIKLEEALENWNRLHGTSHTYEPLDELNWRAVLDELI